MSLWTPNGSDAPSAPNIIVAGAKIRHRCDYCEAIFYSTGDRDADDRRFLRHEKRCWDRNGLALAEEQIDTNKSEPLFQSDEEYNRWAREKAERERNPFVKGTSAWDPRTADGKRREG